MTRLVQLLVLGLLVLAGCDGTQAGDGDGSPVAVADVTYEGLRLAVPSDWDVTPVTDDDGSPRRLWTSTGGEDGTRAGLQVEVSCADRSWADLQKFFSTGQHDGWASWELTDGPHDVEVRGAQRAARQAATFWLAAAKTGQRVEIRSDELYALGGDRTVYLVQHMDVAHRFDQELADRVLTSVEVLEGRCKPERI